MTQARNIANGVRTPSLSQLLLAAVLRCLVEPALHATRLLRLAFVRPVRGERPACTMHESPPAAGDGSSHKDPTPGARQRMPASSLSGVLILRDAFVPHAEEPRSGVSKHKTRAPQDEGRTRPQAREAARRNKAPRLT